jgi:hypothetical protein
MPLASLPAALAPLTLFAVGAVAFFKFVTMDVLAILSFLLNHYS